MKPAQFLQEHGVDTDEDMKMDLKRFDALLSMHAFSLSVFFAVTSVVVVVQCAASGRTK